MLLEHMWGCKYSCVVHIHIIEVKGGVLAYYTCGLHAHSCMFCRVLLIIKWSIREVIQINSLAGGSVYAAYSILHGVVINTCNT